MLEGGGMVDPIDSLGRTPLHYATESGSSELCDLLVQNFANVSFILSFSFAFVYDFHMQVHSHDSSNTTPLVIAAKNGFHNILNLYLQKGANVNSRTKLMVTSLHEAARGNHVKCAAMLLEKAASLKVLDILHAI